VYAWRVARGAWRGVHGASKLDAAAIAYWQPTLTQATQAARWAQELAQQYWTPTLVTGVALREHLAAEQMNMRALLTELGFNT